MSLSLPGGGGPGFSESGTSGVGFGETVGIEPVAQYHARALAYLASIAPS
jgi:hypothetical protein